MPYRYMFVTAVYCLGIFVLSSDPDPRVPHIEIPFMDKAVHLVLFGGLCAVVSFGLRKSIRPITAQEQIFVPAAFAILYGLSDEIHQIYVPNRTFEWTDLLADAMGAGVAQVFLCGVLWRGNMDRSYG